MSDGPTPSTKFAAYVLVTKKRNECAVGASTCSFKSWLQLVESRFHDSTLQVRFSLPFRHCSLYCSIAISSYHSILARPYGRISLQPSNATRKMLRPAERIRLLLLLNKFSCSSGFVRKWELAGILSTRSVNRY
jgi:hypothetical protein